MRKIAMLAPLLCSTPLAAQTINAGPDMGTYTAQPAIYAAGTTPNVLGDGSDAKGGTAPAFTTHPEPSETTDIVPPGWISGGGISFCELGSSPNCTEKKWRTEMNGNHFNNDDFLRYWSQPGVAHCHEYAANKATNAYTTRASVRARPASTAAGGPALATPYWHPCIIKTINGKVYAIPATKLIFYYQEDGSPVDDLQFLHTLLGFIGGVEMDDPDDLLVKAEIAAANAQPGTAGRYEYAGNGNAGYVCQTPSNAPAAVKGGGYHSAGFTLADGTDPWEGRCVDGSTIYPEFNAPQFWDGVNVRSPGGYKHFRYGIKDNVTGKIVGPNHWFKVPTLQGKSFHRSRGWNDYKTWSLSSDAMMAAKLGRAVLPGESWHFDWMNGWHRATLRRWLAFCLGIGTNQPHQCDYSTLDASGRLISDSPAPDGSRNPQVNLNAVIDSNDPTQLHLVDTARAAHINMKGS
jgi:hypothetical protein